MRVGVFSTKKYTRTFLTAANERYGHELVFFEPRLTVETAALGRGFPAVCIFVNDHAGADVLKLLRTGGTRLIALRCAGFNNVDLAAVKELGVTVVRVPAYSPYAVAEHTVGLILALNRKIHRAYARVRDGNLALGGLLGFDLHGRTVGVVGTGRIGTIVARILSGFGCDVLACDPVTNEDLAGVVTYVTPQELLGRSDIVTLHCPLTPATHHFIDAAALEQMKEGAMLINTSRGALIDTQAVIAALKSGRLGYLGLDVYEEEADLFFEDLSDQVIRDDVFARLLTFPNVIITGHQAFFTREAMENIAETTLANVSDFEADRPLANEVTIEMMARQGGR
jgi:D-lactate dehydrogenase